MQKQLQKIHEHLHKPVQSHHYVAFMAILGLFFALGVATVRTYASQEGICDPATTDCNPTSESQVVEGEMVKDFAKGPADKALIKLKTNTLPTYQKMYGRDSKEATTAKVLISKLKKVRENKPSGSMSSKTGNVQSSISDRSSSAIKKMIKTLPEEAKKKLGEKAKKKKLTLADLKKELGLEDGSFKDVKQALQDTYKAHKEEANTSIDSAPIEDPMLPIQSSLATKAMTWKLLGQKDNGVVLVGADEITNAYVGDTDVTTSLPLLCINKSDDTREVPSGLETDFYNGWSQGKIQLSQSHQGSEISSHDVANTLCSQDLGDGWEFAEFHHQSGGRHRYAYGDSSQLQGRFRVGITDQGSNPRGYGWYN